MDWSDTNEQAAFRDEVRRLINERLPQHYRDYASGPEVDNQDVALYGWQSDLKSDDAGRHNAATEWARALSDRGWIAPHWPQEYGGAGLSAMEQFIYNEEMSKAAAPSVGGMGVSLLGPTLIVHGSEEQKREQLPKILAGERVWAQGYSEPGAGSDLAGLQTRAERDGDEYVVNGQKIWTSGAHWADWIFALVRTDPEAPKHRGISFLMMDITTPGLNVRPIPQMDWGHSFNETFFDDVRVPVENLVGEENRGWYVGMTLLDFERSNIAGAVRQRRTIDKLLGYLDTEEGAARSRMGPRSSLRHEIAERYIETDVMYQYSLRIISMQNAGQLPNYEASMSKLFNSELDQRLKRTATQVFGLYSNLWEEPAGRETVSTSFVHSYVIAVPSTIRGGTSEIQRNIIATRGLGLPRG